MSLLPSCCCCAIVILLTVSASASRPSYNFTGDVFKELPEFPDDFWTRKEVFDTQRITADRLTPEYYLQPEILPGWDALKDRIYNDPDRYVGTYGASMYPSLFTVSNVNTNKTFYISTILHTALGVALLQGIRLEAVYNSSALKVKGPDESILLRPTYPHFDEAWSRIVIYEITLLREGNYTITIYERLPDTKNDSAWKSQYGSLYASGASVLGLQVPKLKIHINSITTPSSPTSDEEDDENSYLWLFIIGLIVLGVSYVYIKKRRNRKKIQEEIKDKVGPRPSSTPSTHRYCFKLRRSCTLVHYSTVDNS